MKSNVNTDINYDDESNHNTTINHGTATDSHNDSSTNYKSKRNNRCIHNDKEHRIDLLFFFLVFHASLLVVWY